MRRPSSDLCPVGLQPAVHVVQLQARDAPADGVEDPGQDSASQRIAPLRLPAGDEIEPLVELGEQARDLGRVVLEVAVDRHHRLALGLRETGGEGGGLAEVPPQADDAGVVRVRVQARQRRERPVGRAVVDEHDLPRLVERVERRLHLVVEEARRCALHRVPGRRRRSSPGIIPAAVADSDQFRGRTAARSGARTTRCRAEPVAVAEASGRVRRRGRAVRR